MGGIMLYRLGQNTRKPEQERNSFGTCGYSEFEARSDDEAIKIAQDDLEMDRKSNPTAWVGGTLYEYEGGKDGKMVKNFKSQNGNGEYEPPFV